MAITGDQRALRRGRLGSSDAGRIMAGRWLEVWREKTGRTEPPNLDFVPAVQIGVVTEVLHARFYTWKTGIGCVPSQDTLVHPEYPFLVAHPDFLTWSTPSGMSGGRPDTVMEAKFHGGFKTDEDMAEDHYWQVQHQMMVGGFGQAVLSILRPTAYAFLPVMRNDMDIGQLLENLRAFWWHVENDVVPTDPMAVEPPPFDRMRVVDMSLHNRFAALAAVLDEHRHAVLVTREAEAELKALMPSDVRVAYAPRSGGGVMLSRSRDGRLSLRFGALPRKYRTRVEPWLPDWQGVDWPLPDQAGD